MNDSTDLRFTVQDIMNELLVSNVIPHKDLTALKRDSEGPGDPNLLMELRHGELKERRQRRHQRRLDSEEVRREDRFGRSETDGHKDILCETIFVDGQIEKFRRRFETENRKMNRLILDIRQSGKEMTNKSKSNFKNESKAQTNTDDKSEKLVSRGERSLSPGVEGPGTEKDHFETGDNIDSHPMTWEPKNTDYHDELCKLNQIKTYLNSLDDFDSGSQNENGIDDKFENLNSLFRQMEHLNDAFESLKDTTSNRTSWLEEGVTEAENEFGKRQNKNTINNRKTDKSSIAKSNYDVDVPCDEVQATGDDKTRRTDTNLMTCAEEIRDVTTVLDCDVDKQHWSCVPSHHAYNASDFAERREASRDTRYPDPGSSLCQPKPLVSDDDDVVIACHVEANNPTEKSHVRQEGDYNERVKYLALKFWTKWKDKTKLKIDKRSLVPEISFNSRNAVESKFDAFISKLQKRMTEKHTNGNELRENSDQIKNKAVKSINYGDKVESRFKNQRDIIEKQRNILNEQRKKIKLLEQVEIDSKKMRPSRKKVGICPKNSSKTIQCKEKSKLSKESREDEPQFLVNMAKRAEDRKERREKLKELQLKKEEEKLKFKMQQEEERKMKEEEAKYAQIKAEQMTYLKKLLQEEDRRTQTRNVQEAERRLTVLNRETLLSRYMQLWKRAIANRDMEVARVAQIFEVNLKVKVLQSLKCFANQIKQERIEFSQIYRRCKLQKKYWTIWWKQWKESKEMNQVAEDYNCFRLTLRALIGLAWNREQNHKIQDELMLEAISYHSKRLLSKGFWSLRTYPRVMYNEREQEKRIRMWEEKVKEVLPDFSIT